MKIQQIATDAQKAQAEYQKLADKIGFKECGGATDMARIGVLTGGGDCPGSTR